MMTINQNVFGAHSLVNADRSHESTALSDYVGDPTAVSMSAHLNAAHPMNWWTALTATK